MKNVIAVVLAALFFLTPVVAGAAIINGGFEDDFTGWTTMGSTGLATVANFGGEMFLPYAGATIGAITYPAMTGYVWENSISQSVILGPDDNYLVLYYNFWTFDEAPFDAPGFTVQINGKDELTIDAGDYGDGVTGTLDYSGWQMFSVDVSSYYSADPRPFALQIAFNAGNTGDNQYPSGVFLDDIRLQANPVPIPPTVLMLAPGLIGLLALRRKRS
jgi:hypothetical protein